MSQASLKSYNAKNVVNTVVNHCGFSRQYLISWINEAIGTKRYTKIEELCDGVGYCIIMEKIFPECLISTKIKYDTKIEIYKLHNLKILQGAMTRCKVSQDVPINLLIKGKYQDNFEYAQWFKKFFDCNSDGADKENSSSSISQPSPPQKKSSSKSSRFMPPNESPMFKRQKALQERNSFQKPTFKTSAEKAEMIPDPELTKKIEELTAANAELTEKNKMYEDKLKQIGEDMSDLMNRFIEDNKEDVIKVPVSDVLEI